MRVMNKLMNFLGLQEEEEVLERERYEEYGHDQDGNGSDQRKNKGNIVSIHTQKNVRLILSEPRSYEEAQQIADHLRSRRPVIINLQRVRPDQAVRIVDFISGTVYALNGNIAKIGPNIFMCTPDSVEIQGSITEMLDEEKASR
jgi:cell division inhibitor SepF